MPPNNSPSGNGLKSQSSNYSPENVGERIACVENSLVVMSADGQPQWENISSIAKRMQYYQTPGVSVAVIDGNKLDWVQGYGVITSGQAEPVTERTLFHAGSVAKTLSAAAALTLVEHGLLDLDADVNTRISSWRIPENEFTREEKVTLRHLLSHSAGINDGLTDLGPNDPIPPYVTYGNQVPQVSLKQLLEAMPEYGIESTRVVNVPGTCYRYTNADYAILELLVEDCTGMPFEDFMQAAVLDRLGMINCSYRHPLPQELQAYAASEHLLDGNPVEGGRANFPFHAAGSLWTTPGDLAIFMIDLVKAYQGETGHLLSPVMAQEMLSPQIEIQHEQLGDSSGLGVVLQGSNHSQVAFHAGGTWGSCCILWFYPRLGKGAIVMTNSPRGSLLRFEILLGMATAYGWPMN